MTNPEKRYRRCRGWSWSKCLIHARIVFVAVVAAAESGWKTVKGERFSDIRVEQATEVGAEVLVTACPYCISHFEDSRLALEDAEDGGGLEVKDITEIIAEVI